MGDGWEAAEAAEMASDRAANIREAAQALLDALDIPEFGDGALARIRALSLAPLPDVPRIAEAASRLRQAIEVR